MNTNEKQANLSPSADAIVAMDAQWLRETFAKLSAAAITRDQTIGSLDWESFAKQARTRFACTALKDHIVRETVSQVTEVARQYRDAEQLRARISSILVPVLGGSEPQMYTVADKGGRYFLVGTAMPAGTAKNLNIGPLSYYTDAMSGDSYYRLPDDFVQRTIPLATNSDEA